MRLPRHLLLVSLALALPALLMAATPDERRQKIRAQSDEVIGRLEEARPGTREVIGRAVGYATFRNRGVKIGVAGTGAGRGLAVLNSPRAETFMRFVEVQAGLGAGIRKYDLVFVFATREAYDDFLEKGWEASGQSTVAVRSEEAGAAFEGAVAVSPGVWVYQLTSAGLAAEVTIKGTKYFRDKDLN